MANLIMCTGGIQATCNQLRQKLKANENWDKHQTLKDIKGHTLGSQLPPFSTPSKLFILHGEVKSYRFTIVYAPESMFINYPLLVSQ